MLTLLPVCSVPGSATSVLKYVLDFPDLLPSLSALAHKWQSCTASAAAVVDGATGDGDGESVGVRSLEVVSPVEVLGLSLTWLLSALQVQWTSPAGSSVAAGMGSAVVLDTLLTSFEVSVDQVRGEMNKVLLTLPDLFAAQQSRQSSTEENVAESAWEEAEERPEDLPGAFPAIDLLPGDVPEESGGSLDDIQRKIAAAMLSHDSDSDNEGAQKGSKNKNKKAGSSSTVAAEVPVVDVAAIESRKKRKHASHRYNAIVSFLSGLSEVLQILAGEGACAPILRRMCAVIALEKQKSVASMHVILQQQLTQFVRELMNKATELIQLIRSTTTENGSCEGAENTGTAKDKAAVGGGSSQLGSKVDVVKKQLKALQGLLQGGTSSKAD